jgi:hypothetical protein
MMDADRPTHLDEDHISRVASSVKLDSGPPPIPFNHRRSASQVWSAFTTIAIVTVAGCALWGFAHLLIIWLPRIDRFISTVSPVQSISVAPKSTKAIPAPKIIQSKSVPKNPEAVKDPEKEEFVSLVQKNAEDPKDLEIVEWGKKSRERRVAKFRCKLVGYSRTGNPVMREDAEIMYKGGKIESAGLSRTYQIWYP